MLNSYCWFRFEGVGSGCVGLAWGFNVSRAHFGMSGAITFRTGSILNSGLSSISDSATSVLVFWCWGQVAGFANGPSSWLGCVSNNWVAGGLSPLAPTPPIMWLRNGRFIPDESDNHSEYLSKQRIFIHGIIHYQTLSDTITTW